jgi:hypothetical protein
MGIHPQKEHLLYSVGNAPKGILRGRYGLQLRVFSEMANIWHKNMD